MPAPPRSLPSCLAPLSPHGTPGCQDCPRNKQRGSGRLSLTGACLLMARHLLTHLLSSLTRNARHTAGPWHRLPRGASLPLQRISSCYLAGGSAAFCSPQGHGCTALPSPSPCRLLGQHGAAEPQNKQDPKLRSLGRGTQRRTSKPVIKKCRDRTGTWLLMPPNPCPLQGQAHLW